MLVVLVHNLSYISIHAPARGATAARSCPAAVVLFQSTPPRGGRQNHCKGRRAPRHISIHAPARGATCRPISMALLCIFQSTPPRGGRPSDSKPPIKLAYFNPRPREGGDCIGPCNILHVCMISIHAPARGATTYWHPLRKASCISIHAPARGATALSSTASICIIFQSTPPRGGRQQRCTVLPADL